MIFYSFLALRFVELFEIALIYRLNCRLFVVCQTISASISISAYDLSRGKEHGYDHIEVLMEVFMNNNVSEILS